MFFLASENLSVQATETALTINDSSTKWLKHPKMPTNTETITTSKRQKWMQQRRNASAGSRVDLARAKSEVSMMYTSSDKKSRNARTRTVDHKVQAVVAEVVVDAVGVAVRAEVGSEIVVEAVEEDVVAVAEAVAEASKSLWALCLFYASIAAKAEHHWVDPLCSFEVLFCLIHAFCNAAVDAHERPYTTSDSSHIITI